MQHALQDTERGVEDLGKEMDNGGQKALSFGDLVKSNLASEAIIGGVKLMASAIKEAAEALVDLSKQSIQGFAEQEQLIGEGVGFERIRRITGYLVGTLDRFNNGKRAEEHDRVKHSVTTCCPMEKEHTA